MNIAFCISGHLRHYDRLKESYLQLKKTLEKYGNIDVFICTWNKINTNKSWSHCHGLSASDSHKKRVDLSDIENFYETSDIQILNEEFYESEYSPLNYQNLTYNTYNWDHRGIYNNVPHCIKTAYLIYECNKMKKLKEFTCQRKYDLVFRLRPDSIYNSQLMEVDFSSIDLNKLYIAEYHSKPYADFGRFAFGGSEIMDKYSNSYLRTSAIFDKNIFGDPEKIYYKSIIDMIEPGNIGIIPNWVLISAENSSQTFLR
jgi:hypothetical protein